MLNPAWCDDSYIHAAYNILERVLKYARHEENNNSV